MKILIGVDDSAYSQAALDWVRRTSWPSDTEVIVMSVARGVMVAYANPEFPASTYTSELFEEEVRAHQEIATRYERQLKETGLKTRAKVAEGDPRESLVTTARDLGVDLIVLGSHGRTGLSKLVMGSVASHVVAHAPCSVLVVKLPKR